MAPRATGFAKKPAAAKAAPAPKAAAAPVVLSEPPPPSKPVPLRLAKLIAPYKKHGRLAVRVERVPQKARLTRGRNNGEGSWSLASDELEGLEYQPPDGITEIAALAIRIIALDQDGATLAVVDLPSSDEDGSTEQNPPDEAYLGELAGELEHAKALLAAREAEIAELRQRHVASAGGGADKIVHLHQEMEQAQTALRLVRTEAEQAARRMERDLAEAIAAAEERWKAGEADRIAAAQEKLRTDSEKTIAQLTRRSELAETALADAQKKSGAAADIELRRLKDEHAALTARLAERETATAASAAAHETELRRLRDEQAALKANAEKSGAAAVTAYDAELRKQKDETAALKAKLAEREAANEAELKRLKDDQAAAKAKLDAREQAAAAQASELQRVKDELSALNAKLAERETALSEARSKTATGSAQEAELRRLKSDYAALGTKLADRDAAYLASSKTHESELRRLKEDQAAAAAKLAEREAAFAEVQSKAEAGSVQAAEVARLKDELVAVTAKLAERDTALSSAGTAHDAELRRLKDEHAAVSANLAEREAALTEARSKTDAGAAQEAELGKLREEFSTVKAKLADRDAALLASNTVHELELRRAKEEQAATSAKLAERDAELSTARAKVQAGVAVEAELRGTKAENTALNTKLTERDTLLAAVDGEVRRLRDEHATATAKLADREAALVDARARADALAPLITVTESELRRLKDEHAVTTAKLADREAALTEARSRSSSSVDTELNRLQDENTDLRAKLGEAESRQGAGALEAAKAKWQEEEAARAAAVRTEADAALAVATARFEAAQTTIEELQVRTRAAALSNDSVVIARLRSEIEELRRTLAEREADLAQTQKPPQQITIDPDIFIDRPSRRRKRPRTSAEEEREGRHRLTVDMLIVMLFAAAIVLAWPFVLPLLPNDWQWYIYEATTSIEGELSVTPHPTPPAGVVLAKPMAAAQAATAVITHGANMRAQPAANATVVATLKRGDVVVPGEVRGSWTAVLAGGKQGWVFSTYLKPAGQ